VGSRRGEAQRAILGAAGLIIIMMIVSPEVMCELGGNEALEVLVIGDTIPDESFFRYDPSFRYRRIQWPSWAQAWSGEDVSRWLNTQEAARSFVPADFIIELPYLSLGHPSIELRIRQSIESSLRMRNASLLLPVPQTILLASFAPDHTRVDDPFDPSSLVPRQNPDVLGGKLSTQFSVQPLTNPLTDFDGLISGYHDSNLFVMEDPHPSADTVAVMAPEGPLLGILGGSRPWLLHLNLSDTPTGNRIGARGYAWKCASPLTGIFFFPRGGYVATSVIAGAGYVHVDNVKTGEEHDYAWDILSHMILSSTGRDIPDLLIAHTARGMFARYYTKYADAYRALEFADMVSSSSQTYTVWLDLARIEKDRKEAGATYVGGNVDGSIQIMEGVLLEVESARKRGERVLSVSIVFVRFAEYGVVGSTFLIALSVTLHFVYRPRMKQAGVSRYISMGAETGEALQVVEAARPLHTHRARWPTRKRTLTLVVPFLVAILVLGALSKSIREMVSWEGVYVGTEEYGRVEGKEQFFKAMLIARPYSTGSVSVSEGVAWIEGDRPEAVRIRAHWPFELERSNQTSLLVYAREEDAEQLRALSRYVGLIVEIRGKLRQPVVTYMGQEYVVQGYFELVPGSVRLSTSES